RGLDPLARQPEPVRDRAVGSRGAERYLVHGLPHALLELGAALGEFDVEPGALTGEVFPELADHVLEQFGGLAPAGLDARGVLLAGQVKRSQRDSGRGFLT